MFYPETIVLNANVITVDKKGSVFEAIAINDGKIVSLGKTDELKDLAGPNTTIIDADKKTILPGFIDAHCHLLSLAGKQLLQVDCSENKVKSIDDIVLVLQKKAISTPKIAWVLGAGYDDTKLKERRHPNRWDLDKASTAHPIHLRHVSGHIGVVNTKALYFSGITKETEDPHGGIFDRNNSGELTGVCREEAEFLFLPGISDNESIIPPLTKEEELKALQLASKEYNSFGITSVGDALVSPTEIETYQSALAKGILTVRVYMIVTDTYLPLLKRLGLRTGFGNDFLKLGSIKSFVDGAIAGRTAWLCEPYEGRPYDYGIQTKKPEDIERTVTDAHCAGFQVSIHANGDRAINMVLDIHEKVLQIYPRDNHRHRIAHCTVVNRDILKRIKKLGLVVLPFTTYIYQHGEKMEDYGSRISMMFAHRSFLDYGIPVGGSSDSPCASEDPLLAIQTMVTRQSADGKILGPEQRISVNEAIRIYTTGGAYSSFEENIKGSLELGKFADFVILSEDPYKVPVDNIRNIVVEKTFVNGMEVFSRS